MNYSKCLSFILCAALMLVLGIMSCGGCSSPPNPRPSCTDGVQNGNETGMDCGGLDCPPCPLPPSCTDGIKNGDETGIDCGGANCPTCQPDHPVSIEKELMITNLAVVDGPEATTGVFSVGHLIKNMASTEAQAKDLMLSFLNSFQNNNLEVNGFTIPARPDIVSKVINPWKARDGQSGVSDAAWNMDFDNAPFRLLAIVNRLDLGSKEGRFVYGIFDENGTQFPFTVIFEYSLPNGVADEVKWAKEWHHLGGLDNFGPTYIDRLKKLTNRFTNRNMIPTNVNGSAIRQVRTNENELNQLWELREFTLSSTTGLFQEVTRKRTPDDTFLDPTKQAALVKYIEDNISDLRDQTHELPDSIDLNGTKVPFVAGNTTTPFNFEWTAVRPNGSPISQAVFDTALHRLSLNTCNGCHGRSSLVIGDGTFPFTQIDNRNVGQTAVLSGFLNDPNLLDKFNQPFDELGKRKAILGFLIGQTSPSLSISEEIALRNKRTH